MEEKPQGVYIETGYIALGQFLKLVDLISTGGEAKPYLAEHEILVNGEKEDRRGRKLYPGDEVEIEGRLFRLAAR